MKHTLFYAAALLMTAFAVSFTACDKDTTKVEDKTYTVTFDADGGTPAPKAQTVGEGEKVTKPTDPAKAGNAFDGWFNTTTQWNFEVNTVSKDLTLKAKWSAISKEALIALIDECEALNAADYITETWEVLQQALTAAQAIAANANATAEQVTTAYDALHAAKEALETLPVLAVESLFIDPAPVEGVILIIAGQPFSIFAEGRDSIGNPATNSAVTFTQSLTDWADGEITVDSNNLSFTALASLTSGVEKEITITSADDSEIKQTITLKIVTEEELLKAQFIAAVDSLPAPASITDANAAAIEAAYTLYGNLDAALKSDPTVATAYGKLEACKSALHDYQSKTTFITAVDALPVPVNITDAHAAAIEAVYTLYDNLSAAMKSDPAVATAYGKLEACKNALNDYQSKTTFIAAVNALPAPANITDANTAAIEAVYTLYGNLGATLKSDPAVTAAYGKLEACKTALHDYQSKVAFIAAVNALPEPVNITDAHAAAIEAVYPLYDNLSAAMKSDPAVVAAYNKWDNCEIALYSYQSRAKFIAAVNVLPEPANVADNHGTAIYAARNLYFELSEADRAYPEVAAAFAKVEACLYAYQHLPVITKYSYTFSGNQATVTDLNPNVSNPTKVYTYTPNGAFPNGTYITAFTGGGGQYQQYRLVLNSDNTVVTSFKVATDTEGNNIIYDSGEGDGGTYTYTGNQAEGGTLTLTFPNNN